MQAKLMNILSECLILNNIDWPQNFYYFIIKRNVLIDIYWSNFFIHKYSNIVADIISMQLELDTQTTVNLTNETTQEYIEFKGKIKQSVSW